MDCAHASKDTLEDGSTVICVDCGAVLEEVALSTIEFHQKPSNSNPKAQPSTPNKLIHHKSYSEQGRERLTKYLMEISKHFCWSAENERIMALHGEILDMGIADYGKGGEKAVAALYVLLGRQNSVPVTVKSMASLLSESPESIGLLMIRIISSIPDLRTSNSTARFLERHVSVVSQSSNKQSVAKHFHGLTVFCLKRGLWEGRQPEPLSFACLALAMEADLGTVNKQWIDKYSKELGLAPKTVYQRYCELRQELFKLGQTLPWSDCITIRNVPQYIPDIFEYVREVPFTPPAYARSVTQSRNRKELIERVQLNLFSSPITEEEFIVDYLLQEEYSADEILALSRLSLNILFT